jgi:hypothetical protein
MKDWKTSLAGAIAALALSGFVGLGLPEPWPKVLGLICAGALGALGWHATDCTNCPGRGARIAAGLAVVFLVAFLAGCTLGRFSLRVASPTFGSVSISAGDTAIGRPAELQFTDGPLTVCSTNAFAP